MNTREIKIISFAGLRKYFGGETTINVEPGCNYSKVIEEMQLLNPEATEILSSCRIAVNEEFVQLSESMKSEDTLFLIPPSSGG
ncbi:MAG: MoaD/ThiS family protein [Draconibacterium sp.]